MQRERDDLYSRFVKAIHEVQQKSGFKNLLLERKLTALADTLEKKVTEGTEEEGKRRRRRGRDRERGEGGVPSVHVVSTVMPHTVPPSHTLTPPTPHHSLTGGAAE